MWFARSGSRRNTKEQPGTEETASPSKPLLEPLVYQPGSTNSSPTKTKRTSLSPTPGRLDFTRGPTTPTITHDYALTEIPSRLSASSSIGHGRPSLNIHANSLLQPPTARSQKHPSTVNLAEEELEGGTDRLFDPLNGRPIATLSPSRQDAFNKVGSQLDIARGHRNAAEFEDPARQKMWDYLAKIRSLQAEVAAMHLAMDGHGLGDPWGVRPGIHSRAGSVSYAKDTKSPFMENSSSTKVFETLPKTTGIAGDSDSDDEKTKKKNDKGAEEFAELDKMFEKKQEALKAVTVKLRELSSVVRAYHELENPIIEPPARQDAESTQDILTDSPHRKVLPPSTISQSESLQDPLKPSPRPLLAPIFTASPVASLASSSNASKVQAAGLLSPANKIDSRNRRVSLEIGAGGGPHGYIPRSPGIPGPPLLPSPPVSRTSLSRDI